MSRTSAQSKRGKDGRFVPAEVSEPEAPRGENDLEGEGWARGEGFGSIGPASFGTPEQQASLADLQQLQAAVQQEQAKSRDVAERSGARVEQLSEDVLGISSQLATLTTAVTALAATTAAAHKAAAAASAAAWYASPSSSDVFHVVFCWQLRLGRDSRAPLTRLSLVVSGQRCRVECTCCTR